MRAGKETPVNGDRSLSAVFQDILRDIQEIVRSEVRLAKAEIKEEASKAVSSLLWVAGGGVTALLAVVFGLWTAVYAVALVWPMWAATLVVGAILAAAAVVLIVGGIRQFKRVHPIPERTVGTIKENVEWVKQSSK